MDETSQHDSACQTERTNHTNLNPVSEENEFWMSYEEAVAAFTCLNVCRVTNMHEVRMRGKFIRVEDFQDAGKEMVVSKWYYSVEVGEKTRMFVGLH